MPFPELLACTAIFIKLCKNNVSVIHLAENKSRTCRNLVQFLGACIADDNLMLVLEYMDGKSLHFSICQFLAAALLGIPRTMAYEYSLAGRNALARKCSWRDVTKGMTVYSELSEI